MKNPLTAVKALLSQRPGIRNVAKWLVTRKFVTTSRTYKRWIISKAITLDKQIGHKVPGLSIETTLTCNARCVMCAHGYNKMNGTMSMELFQKIIEDCAANGITSVTLSVYGEPFMDPKFFERIEFLRSKGMDYAFISNGSLLTPDKVEKLFALGGLQSVWFSVNGFAKETYEKVMAPLKRDVSYNNILSFFERRKKAGTGKPAITISCVQTKWIGKAELGDLITFWRKAGADSILTGELWPRVGGMSKDTIAEQIGPVSTVHSQHHGNQPCRALWGEFQVYHDGRVGACCFDADQRRLILGDLNGQTLQEINGGKLLQGLRKLHIAGRRDAHPVCGGCTYNGTWLE